MFPRANLEHVGLGGMASTYLFGPNDRRGVDDPGPPSTRPAGLQMLNGQGEWLWRPLHNPETLQISAFIDTRPARLRPPAARPRLRRASRTTTSVSSAVRAFGSCRSASGARARPADRDPERLRGQRQHPRLLAPEGAHAGRRRGSRSPTGSSGAGRRPSARRWRRSSRPASGEATADAAAASSSTSRARGSTSRSPGPSAPRSNVAPGTDSESQGLAISGAQDACASRFELDPGNENACEMRLVLEAGASPSARHGFIVGRPERPAPVSPRVGTPERRCRPSSTLDMPVAVAAALVEGG